MLDLLLTMPYSTIFIILVSLCVAFISSFLNSRVVDRVKMKEIQGQMKELRKKMGAARKRGDRRTLAKLQRKQMAIMKDQQKVMGGQFKTMIITMGPFLAIFYTLNWLFGGAAVAYSPIPIPYGSVASDQTQLTFWGWYMVSMLAVGTPFNRIFKIYG
jgi:uncharacterized membrane protein (DUF106 family)